MIRMIFIIKEIFLSNNLCHLHKWLISKKILEKTRRFKSKKSQGIENLIKELFSTESKVGQNTLIQSKVSEQPNKNYGRQY